MRNTDVYERIMAEHAEADRLERVWKHAAEQWFLQTLAMDASHLPGVRDATVRSWMGSRQTAAITATGWQSWNRPKNASFIAIATLGAASGGGGGFSAASASARGGGGGGATGGMGRGIWMADVLPRQLFILAGNGGSGSTGTGVAGTVGARSCVGDRINAIASSANIVMISEAAAATGGVAGTAAGGQAGGTAATIATNVLGMYMGWAVSLVFIAGQAGAAAGALGAVGASTTPGQSGLPVCAGAGGGSVTTTNTDVAGGQIVANSPIVGIPGGLAAAGNGNDGYALKMPWIGVGGTGGGTAGAAGTGGKGGRGGPGSGGGGGGSGVTGGGGGDGGPGVVMIAWW